MTSDCAVTEEQHSGHSSSAKVASNTFWYGLEIAANFASVFFTSIAIARTFGPKELGYFNYVLWVANLTGAVGALGIPAATRKYMAEYLASGMGGVARSIFFVTLRLQLLVSSILAMAGLFVALKWADPGYRLISVFIVLSLVPRMLTLIPSLANVAAVNLRANAPGALAGIVFNVITVTISLRYGYGLIGISAGMFGAACIELGLKLHSTLRWILPLPKGVSAPPDLKPRMFRFSAQSIMLMLIDLVVWNRSDVFFLKLLDKDIRQITFFSLAFNLSEKVVLIPDTLGLAMGASLMAQYTRGKSQLQAMASTAARYMLLLAVPLLLGMAALSGPIVETVYGSRYLPVVPVLITAALFAIPKALRHPVEELLQAAEEQKFIIFWFIVCGAVDVGLDLLLIPRHGALGASVANGAAQTLAVLGIWFRAGRIFHLSADKAAMLKICISGLIMGAVVMWTATFLSHWVALITGVLLGGGVYCLMLRLTGTLVMEDRERFLRARRSVPAPLRVCFSGLIDAVAPLRAHLTEEKCQPALPL